MLARTRKAKKILSVGQNVRIGISDVDRARTQQKNVIGVILEVSLEQFSFCNCLYYWLLFLATLSIAIFSIFYFDNFLL